MEKLYELFIVIVLGIVEGVTEFLPVSSTGHLLLCADWFDLDLESGYWKLFTIFIQIGAIAAVVVYFRKRIRDLLLGRTATHATPLEISMAAKAKPEASPILDYHATSELISESHRGHAIVMVLIASLPLVIAYFAEKWSEQNMEHPWVIALALLVGGILMILIEFLRPNTTTHRIESITWKQALGIGSAQVLAAVFPGTSRSAATIMGGMVAGLSREAAAEFSFFLAIPAMTGACGYKLLKYLKNQETNLNEMFLLLIGTLVSFLVAWAVIAVFMTYIKRHTFIPFAIYRIVVAVVVFWSIRG